MLVFINLYCVHYFLHISFQLKLIYNITRSTSLLITMQKQWLRLTYLKKYRSTTLSFLNEKCYINVSIIHYYLNNNSLLYIMYIEASNILQIMPLYPQSTMPGSGHGVGPNNGRHLNHLYRAKNCFNQTFQNYFFYFVLN